MDYFIFFLIFVFGLVIGSFLNVVIFRLDTEEKIVNSRSKCLFCGHLLSWRDLFPVFSFVFLKGKCRYCRKKISWQYPLVEIATGILFVALFAKIFGTFDILDTAGANSFSVLNLLSFSSLIFIFSALVVIFVFDLRYYIIPDEVIYPAIFVASLWRGFEAFAASGQTIPGMIGEIIFPAVLASGFFLFLVIATKGEGMGGGDVKLGFLMGIVLGWPKILLALFAAFISGAIVGVALIIFKKKGMKSMVPFGPFLIFGLLLSFFYGNAIIEWYWNTFLF